MSLFTSNYRVSKDSTVIAHGAENLALISSASSKMISEALDAWNIGGGRFYGLGVPGKSIATLSNADFSQVLKEGRVTTSLANGILGETKVDPASFQRLVNSFDEYASHIRRDQSFWFPREHSRAIADGVFEPKVRPVLKELSIPLEFSLNSHLSSSVKEPLNQRYALSTGQVVDLSTKKGMGLLLNQEGGTELGKALQYYLDPPIGPLTPRATGDVSRNLYTSRSFVDAAERFPILDRLWDPKVIESRKIGSAVTVPMNFNLTIAPILNYQILEELIHIFQRFNYGKPLTKQGVLLRESIQTGQNGLEELARQMSIPGEQARFAMENEIPAVFRELGIRPLFSANQGYHRKHPAVRKLLEQDSGL